MSAQIIQLHPPKDRPAKCSFCGETSNAYRRVLDGANASICEDCLRKAKALVTGGQP